MVDTENILLFFQTVFTYLKHSCGDVFYWGDNNGRKTTGDQVGRRRDTV